MKFEINNFRNIKFLNLELNKKVIVFTGKNNVGKTNILEAIVWFLDNTKTIENVKTWSNKAIDFLSTHVTFKDNTPDFIKINEYEIRRESDGHGFHKFLSIDAINSLFLDEIKKSADSNLIEDSKFYKDSLINTDLTHDNIKKWVNIKSTTKDLHIKWLDELNIRQKYVKVIPKFIYIKNGSEENRLPYKWSFSEVVNDANLKKIFSLVSEEELGDPNKFFDDIITLSQKQPTPENDKKLDLKVKEFTKKINTAIRLLFKRFDLSEIPIISINDKSKEITLKIESNEEQTNTEEKELKFNSSGYKAFFWIILNIEHFKKNTEKAVILLDEPDKNLYPLLQSQLRDYLENRGENIKIIMTTHSPFLMLPSEQEIFNVMKDKTGAATILKWQEQLKKNKMTSFSLLCALKLTSEKIYERVMIFIEDEEISKEMSNDHLLLFNLKKINGDEFKKYENNAEYKIIEITNLLEMLESERISTNIKETPSTLVFKLKKINDQESIES